MSEQKYTRVALYLQDKHPLRDGMEYARYAEEKGFEAVWQAESRLVRDAIVPMAAFAAVTDRIKVGSGVINNWTRNIGLLAATFLTLDDLAEVPPEARAHIKLGKIARPLDDVDFVSADLPGEEIMRKLAESDYGVMLVLEGGKVVGLIRQADIMRWMVMHPG